MTLSEDSHRQHYNDLLGILARVQGIPVEEVPKWDDLTEQQRNNIRAENERYQDELNDLGDVIRGNMKTENFKRKHHV